MSNIYKLQVSADHHKCATIEKFQLLFMTSKTLLQGILKDTQRIMSIIMLHTYTQNMFKYDNMLKSISNYIEKVNRNNNFFCH